MAPQYTLVSLLSFATAASAQFATTTTTQSGSAFWTYTSRLAAFPSPSLYTSANGVVRTYSYTETRTIKPTVTLSATPTSTTVFGRYYDDIQYVVQYYGIGAVSAESDLLPERDYSATTATTSTSIVFSMPVVMSAPASCPTPYTVTATATVDIPSVVWDQIRPTSTVSVGLSTYLRNYVYDVQTWYLSPGAAPFTASSYSNYRYYIASCSTLPSYLTRSTRTVGASYPTSTSNSRSGGSDDDDDYYYCSRYSYYGCGTPLTTWIIVIASVIPGLFLLGFLESWFWFRRLMNGKSAMRFGTVCWVLISLWVMCFTRMQDARSKDDQKLLQEKWKNMGSGAAFKAWMKWGFKHRYPVEHLGQFSKTTVGVVPEGQPLHPAMNQMPPAMFTPGAPPPAFMPGMGGAPGAPGPGPVYYYGPPPPGWVPTPDGQGFMPPQGYMSPPPQGHMYPPPQQAGYYSGDVSKAGTVVSSSPVSSAAHLSTGQTPQTQGYPVSPIGQSPPQIPPQAPHSVYPAPDSAQMPAPTPPPQGPVPPPPQMSAPPSEMSEAPGAPVQRPANGLPAPRDQNNRDLYE